VNVRVRLLFDPSLDDVVQVDSGVDEQGEIENGNALVLCRYTAIAVPHLLLFLVGTD